MTSRLAKKVLLVGWDAADWKTINPLLDAGRMPNLERLVGEGVMGSMATLKPDFSPMLWTSIATGKRPFKHGVLGFTEPDPVSGGIRPVTVLSRKTKALWNILSQSGLTSQVTAWWPSHPAEPIKGAMVSNHYQRAVGPLDKPWPLPANTVHPAHLAQPLADLRRHPQTLNARHILPFVPRASEIDQDKDHRLENLAKIIAETLSIEAAALALMNNFPWDLAAVYFDAIDHFCHGFMRFRPPRQSHVPEQDFELFRDVVDGAYILNDIILGRLMAAAGPDAHVILVSDHGFHSDHLRPKSVPREPAGPAVQHRPYGILAMKGPGLKKDERIYGASLLDVCPTILALFGLPVGEDMDGRPLVGAFEEPLAFQSIPGWDEVAGPDGQHPPDKRLDPIEARAALGQLAALGYIEPPDENREKAAEKAARELTYNLALSYSHADRHLDALPLFESLSADWPHERRFALRLTACYQALGRLTEARRTLDGLLAEKREAMTAARAELKDFRDRNPDRTPQDLSDVERRRLADLRADSTENPGAVDLLWGMQLLSEGDAVAALEHFRRAEKTDKSNVGLQLKLGAVYLRLKRPRDAEKRYRKALEMDPDEAGGHLGLARVLLSLRRNFEAAEAALESVGLRHHNPGGHMLLGMALHRLGQIDRAIQALEVAVAQNPNLAEAYRRLAYIHSRRLLDPVAADRYKESARAAAKRNKAARTWRPLGPPKGESISPRDQVSYPGTHDLPWDPAQTIVVVSGLPRSGTSMMMQMLAAGGLPLLTDEVRWADEDNPRGYFEYAPVKALGKDRSWLPEAKGRAVKIVAQLLDRLPPNLDYRVIFMERPMAEVMASQEKMLERLGKSGKNLSPERLSTVLARQARAVKVRASRRGLPLLTIAYEDCLAEPAAAAARVNAFLKANLDEPAMAAAVAPELRRQRSDPEKKEE